MVKGHICITVYEDNTVEVSKSTKEAVLECNQGRGDKESWVELGKTKSLLTASLLIDDEVKRLLEAK